MPFKLLRQTALGKQVNLEELLQLLVEEVARRLKADRGTLYLVDHARGELVSRVAQLPEISEIRLRIGEGIAGWVALNGEPLIVPDGEQDERFSPRIDFQTGYQTRNILTVPLKKGGDVLGVLQVLNQKEGHFQERDQRRLERLGAEILKVLDETSLRNQLRPDNPRPISFHFNHVVGDSPAMRRIFRRTARAARSNATVLVRGESGSGKELIARAVHVNSPRRQAPFIKVDCAALPAQLIENELFGHEQGAFTGAHRSADGKVRAAEGGTLFLDEIGELPLGVQGKILRLLQERLYLRVGGTQAQQAQVRFVCATHRDLERDVAEGRFRADLYYRLRVIQIQVPNLQERGNADLDRLIDYFLFEFKRRHARPELELSSKARARLHQHSWPGNVRELENALEAAVVLASEPLLGEELFSLGKPLDRDEGREEPFFADLMPLKELERAYIEFVLKRVKGNRSAAARLLGIGRNTLLRKLNLGARSTPQ